MVNDFRAIPAAPRGLRLTIAIPARDEAATIGLCLDALARQDIRSTPLAPFDVILYANSCSDATAAIASQHGAARVGFAVHIVAGSSPPGRIHVGAARKAVMDAAAQRFILAGRPRGLIASVDADTLVDPDWSRQLLAASRDVDAVAGHVFVDDREIAALPSGVRRLYHLEATYRRLRAELESALDPVPEDPAPRHGTFVGANFAVTASAYVAAGGIPSLPRLEDREFLRALRRIDARVRFALDVRAATSARRRARVEGGFGAEREELYRRGRRGRSLYVEDPAELIAELRGRALLRRLWPGRACNDRLSNARLSNARLSNGTFAARTVALACDHFGIAEEALLRLLECELSFGRAYELVAARSADAYVYERVPVEFAIAELRGAVSGRNAALPTRTSAASGPG